MSENQGMEPARIRTIDVTAERSPRDKLLARLRSPFELTFPSAMMWGVMGCAAGFAVSLVKERNDGTLVRLRIAPMTRTGLLAGKALACFTASIFVLVFMIALGCLVFRMRLGNPALLLIAIICTALAWVGIMMLLSVIGRTEQAVGGISWAILVIMAMIGGGMVPLAFLPPFMQKASMLSPIRWGIEALEGAIWRGYSPAEMALPCGVLLAIGAVAFVIAIQVLARRDE
jgi:ABC-2 type transport system permease protein